MKRLLIVLAVLLTFAAAVVAYSVGGRETGKTPASATIAGQKDAQSAAASRVDAEKTRWECSGCPWSR